MSWQRLVDNLFFPLIYLLNRPALDRFDRLVLLFAYRINGMCISWSGSDNLTIAASLFLHRCAGFIGDGTVLDVGANVGSYARAIRSLCPNARIICFEPQPRTFQRLMAKCADLSVEFEQMALAASTGTGTLFELAGRQSSTVASLTAKTLQSHGTVGEAFEVPIDTLDGYCERKGIKTIKLLKVDAEGHDLDVLRGATNMLLRQAIDLIEFEITASNIYTNVHFYQFVDLLQDHRLYRICLNGALAPLQPYDWRFTEVYAIYNVIAVRNDISLEQVVQRRRTMTRARRWREQDQSLPRRSIAEKEKPMTSATKASVTDAASGAFHIMVLAHNEEDRIQDCLDSIYAAEPSSRFRIFVMANGCTDGTEQIVRAYALARPEVELVSIAMPDKCNAWNVFIHETARALSYQSIYYFMDGDARVGRGALSALAQELDDKPNAVAAAAVPGSGRSMKQDRPKMLSEGHLVANLYALRGDFVRRLQELDVRLPIGLEGDDGLIGALSKWNLNPQGEWRDDRIAACERAEFFFESLSWMNSKDWRTYYKRLMRYARRPYEFELIGSELRKHGIKGLPVKVTDIYHNSLSCRFRWNGIWSPLSWVALKKMQRHAMAGKNNR